MAPAINSLTTARAITEEEEMADVRPAARANLESSRARGRGGGRGKASAAPASNGRQQGRAARSEDKLVASNSD